MALHDLKAPQGANKKKRKRVGRGTGSGWGKTAGRGNKGQLSRSGAKIGVGFEGGQMPLQRRLPKRGFKNFCKQSVCIINLKDLARFQENTVVDPIALSQAGLLPRTQDLVKILSVGNIDKPLIVRAQRFSKSAREKIEAAGGKVEIIDPVRKQTRANQIEEK